MSNLSKENFQIVEISDTYEKNIYNKDDKNEKRILSKRKTRVQ